MVKYLGSKRVVIVSGFAGAGKSTLAKKIAEKYKLRYLSSGDLFRKIAAEHNIVVDKHSYKKFIEAHRKIKKIPEIDLKVDELQRKEAEKGNIVIDSWLGGFIIPEGIKIYLKVDLEEAARRISKRDGISQEEARKRILERYKENKERFLKLYNINIDDLSPFHLVLDTTFLDKEETFKVVDCFLENFLEK